MSERTGYYWVGKPASDMSLAFSLTRLSVGNTPLCKIEGIVNVIEKIIRLACCVFVCKTIVISAKTARKCTHSTGCALYGCRL